MPTWSYTIMGSSEAWVFWSRLYEILWEELSEKERRAVNKIPVERAQALIEEHYERLVHQVIGEKSRLAYQSFGVFLMNYGAKMTNAVRELILLHSKWEVEKDQIIDDKDRAERFSHLSDFRAEIKNYTEGQKIRIFYESPSVAIERLSQQQVNTSDYPFVAAPQKKPIDYKIQD